MPKYHFNVRDGVAIDDAIGMELPHFPAARIEAIRRAGELLSNDPIAVALGDDWQLVVTDDQSLVLFTLTLMVHDAPAASRTRVKR